MPRRQGKNPPVVWDPELKSVVRCIIVLMDDCREWCKLVINGMAIHKLKSHHPCVLIGQLLFDAFWILRFQVIPSSLSISFPWVDCDNQTRDDVM